MSKSTHNTELSSFRRAALIHMEKSKLWILYSVLRSDTMINAMYKHFLKRNATYFRGKNRAIKVMCYLWTKLFLKYKL